METLNLVIWPCSIKHLKKLIEGNTEFKKAFGINVSEGYIEWPEVLPKFIERLQKGDAPEEWFSHLIIHKEDNKLIGFCGYKGKPDESGAVEIGYSISPAYRRKGYATEAAKALIENALQYNSVKMVCAHTLAERSASTLVLEKIGMFYKGEIITNEGTKLWRWELERKKSQR